MTTNAEHCTLQDGSFVEDLPTAAALVASRAVQLELPGIPAHEVPAGDCQSAGSTLTEFLNAVGVSCAAGAAQSLLGEFSSLAGVLTAPSWRLRPVGGKRLADVICATAGLVKARLVEQVKENPIVPRPPALLEFLQLEVGFLDHERLVALYLNGQSRLMRIERIADGSLGEVAISAREVIGRGLAIGATAFILVHNHPSGLAVPSHSDLCTTARLKALGKELDLHLLDHWIVARGHFGSIEDFWREAQWGEAYRQPVAAKEARW
jgi:DNA repair protein RadC